VQRRNANFLQCDEKKIIMIAKSEALTEVLLKGICLNIPRILVEMVAGGGGNQHLVKKQKCQILIPIIIITVKINFYPEQTCP
jgi:hypothetical protein